MMSNLTMHRAKNLTKFTNSGCAGLATPQPKASRHPKKMEAS